MQSFRSECGGCETCRFGNAQASEWVDLVSRWLQWRLHPCIWYVPPLLLLPSLLSFFGSMNPSEIDTNAGSFVRGSRAGGVACQGCRRTCINTGFCIQRSVAAEIFLARRSNVAGATYAGHARSVSWLPWEDETAASASAAKPVVKCSCKGCCQPNLSCYLPTTLASINVDHSPGLLLLCADGGHNDLFAVRYSHGHGCIGTRLALLHSLFPGLVTLCHQVYLSNRGD